MFHLKFDPSDFEFELRGARNVERDTSEVFPQYFCWAEFLADFATND